MAVEWHSDQILARLARELVADTDWTISTEPCPEADANLFFPYFTWGKFRDFHATRTAAWFTHREANGPKRDLWAMCSTAVDICFTCATRYLDILSIDGSAFLVTPPLDHELFRVRSKRQRSKRPVIGVSGYVYPSGRKGESLLQAFMATPLGATLDYCASGKGWPVPTKEYSWTEMPDFYRGLDLYLCTSLIEGIPMPPLEALDCGVPVVIPWSVGLLSELPEMPGIAHYRAGDVTDMARAVEKALDANIDPLALRAQVARFTRRQWQDDFARPLGTTRVVRQPLPQYRAEVGDRGVYYVAYGAPARECARKAISSWHQYMPNYPVALVAEEPLGDEDIFIAHHDEDIGARSVKTRIYDLAPEQWRYILYLDADTEIIAPVDYLFQILEDGWDMAICLNPTRYLLVEHMQRPDNMPEYAETVGLLGSEELLQYNGGVFAFQRNEQTRRFFDAWHREWAKWGKRDQAAFDRALLENPLKIWTLGQEWNTVTRYSEAVHSAGILHHPLEARRWKGIIRGRLDTAEAWAALHPGGKEAREQEANMRYKPANLLRGER